MAEEFGDFIEAAPRFIAGVDGKIPLVQATFTHSVLASEITASVEGGLASETKARQSADAALQGGLDDEAADRTEADNTLQANLDAEIAARSAADTTLQTTLNAEISARATADARLQEAIDVLSENLVFSGQLDVPGDTVSFTAASGLPAGPLPAASAGLRGRYVIVTKPGVAPAGSNIPAGTYVAGDWLVCDETPAWYWLKLGHPDLVSADAGNLAELGTDGGVMVPNTSVLMGVVDGSEALPGQIGEYKVTSNTVGVQMTSNVPTQICPLSLTAGDWEIWGSVDYMPPSNVSPNMIAASVSVHPDALPDEDDLMTGVGILNMFTTTALTSGQRQVLMTGQCRSNSAAPLDLYLVAQVMFSGGATVLGKGYICARRVR